MKKTDPRNKFQNLNVNHFEIILKFLNFDDLPHFLRACEKSKSNYLKQTIFKLFQTFHKNQVEKSIEYVISETKEVPKNNSGNIFEKYLNFKKTTSILLPKFMKHVIQTPQFRIVTHVDGFFSIEQKLKKKYAIANFYDLFPQYREDLMFLKRLNFIFSSNYFITSILNHQNNNIFIIFEEGEILICGKTGKIKLCAHIKFVANPTCHFISENKTYFMYYLEKSAYDGFVVYHISSGEIFRFYSNPSLKFIFLNPNSRLDYDFLKNNGNSCGFVESKNFLFNQMMTHICYIKSDKFSNTFIEQDNI